jgi:trimeric autotransporter adhesin
MMIRLVRRGADRSWAMVAATVASAGLMLAGSGQAMAATSDLSTSVDQTYQANGRVDAIVTVGDTVYIGGQFTSMRPAGDPLGTGEVPREHLAALDATTGALLPWNPGANNTVLALAASVDGTTIFIGGQFSNVGGQVRDRLADVDASTGAVLPWAPAADLKVEAIAVTSSLVYVGGTFDTVDGQPRTRLAALDYTGALSSAWAPTADDDVRVLSVAPGAGSIFVGGYFLSVSGDTTQKYLAQLSLTNGAVLPWKNHPPYSVYGITYAGSTLVVAGNGAGGHLGAFDLATGAKTWLVQTDGGVQAVTTLNGVVYAGGHFDNICVPAGQGVPAVHTHGFTCPVDQLTRHKLFAVDPTTGALDPWAPGANSPLGVFGLANDGTSLEVGGDFTLLGSPDPIGQALYPQQGYGQFSPVGG